MKRKYLILATVCLVMTSCSTNSQQATTVGVQQGEICSMNPLVNEKGLIQVRARVKGNVGLMEGMNVTVRIYS